MENCSKWEIFEDRTQSLIKRWRQYCERYPGVDEFAIRAFLGELSDEFTQRLMEK